MRVVVVSDTHVPRFARGFAGLLARVRGEAPDAIVHCGDFTDLAVADALAEIAPFHGVAGNNDGPEIVRRFGRAHVVTFAGCRVGLVHGDGGARGSTRDRAEATFAAESVDAICFGHSHIPHRERRDDGVWILNPGSPLDRRREPRFSYAVLACDATGIDPHIVYFD